jgi:small subunit ribosomal protein S1
VFETTFAEGSTHQGTIIEEKKDKAAIVSLPYGVEGICPKKHLRKEDGSNAVAEETLEFKVIEFNKDARKIVVSHTRMFEAGEDKPTAKKKTSTGAKKSGGGNKAVNANNSSNEKATLGDLDALSALKSEMEKGEK